MPRVLIESLRCFSQQVLNSVFCLPNTVSPLNTLHCPKCSFCLWSPWLRSLLSSAAQLTILQGESSCQVHFFEPLEDIYAFSVLNSTFYCCSPIRMSKILQLLCLLAAVLCPASQLLAPCQELANTLQRKMGFQKAGLTSVCLMFPQDLDPQILTDQ